MTLPTQSANAAPPLQLGYQQAFSNTVRCAFDLFWGHKEAGSEIDSEAVARARAYPSPPMSGSPPLQPKPALEAGRDGASSLYVASRPSDGFRGSSVQLPPANLLGHSLTATHPMARIYPQEPPVGAAFSYPRSEESGRHSSYLQHPHAMHQGLPYTPYISPTGSSSESYAMLGRPSTSGSQPFIPPKPQKKVKAHVASACVPCKRAHLRCDAQRPCSRCLGNGKESSCYDIQHKKRGRPRLRDDKDSRYPPTPEVIVRRPLSIHPARNPRLLSMYQDTLRRNQPDPSSSGSPPSEAIARLFRDRISVSDSNIFHLPFSPTAQTLEPMAYLSVDFDIIKASPVFTEITHVSSLAGRKLNEIISPTQANLVFSLQYQMYSQQRMKEPNYLPPILGSVDQAIRGLGYTGDDLSRFRLDLHEYFSFIGCDGHTRMFPLQIGLAKEGSFYFVVVLLDLQQHQQHASPSRQIRETFSPFHLPASISQPVFGDQADSISLDPQRHRLSEGSVQLSLGLNASSPGINSGISSCSPLSRSEYITSSTYPTPRDELSPASRSSSQYSYQLPPIRSQSNQSPLLRDLGWQRDERSGRVDIGGLLERPEALGRSSHHPFGNEAQMVGSNEN